MPPNRPNAETLFHQALELELHQRGAFLDAACGSDLTLQRRVEALLAAHEGATGFLPEDVAGTPRPSPKTSQTENTGRVIGHYKLLEKLGEGGFGVVWAAEQREPIRRRVALKIIKLGMDTKQVIARFEAERQALATMDHPNIAKVLDAGATDTGRPYFVMELVRGIPVTTYCEEQRLDTKDRLDLFIKICQAIQHAHQKGIIHRDIKPSNIMVTLHDGVPVPKVIDFGIAKATQAELTEKTIYTQFQQFIGTPAYMSPEQAEMSGLDIDTRSDIYSLGVLLYELLTGKTPFDGKALLRAGLDEMRRIIREQEPTRPSTAVGSARRRRPGNNANDNYVSGRRRSADPTTKSQIDNDLDCIVMKCLEKDRTRRYATANGLARDLQRHLDDEPIVARPPSSTYRLQKAFRRNKLAFAAAALVTATLLVGFGVSAWQAIVATRARVAAQTAQQRADTERLRAQASEKSGQRLLYDANMNLAQEAWEQNNIGRLRQLLDETASYPARGFEWYYWQRQAHLEIRTLRGHSDGVWAVAYSPDGRRIATGGSDHIAKIWDAASGQELLSLEGHSDWVSSVAFSPDGRRIFTGSADQTAVMWDAATGKKLRTLIGHRHWITSLAISLDGRHLVTGSHDNTAIVWDAETGANLFALKGHTNTWGPGIGAVAFSPDGQQIVTGSHDHTARTWDAANGTELLTFKGHTGSVWAVAFSRDGRFLVTGSYDKTARVWDAATTQQLLTFDWPDISSPGISSVAFSPTGQRIAVGSWNHMAKVWDVTTGTELFALKGHSDGVSSVAFSPDGDHVLTGSRGHTAKIWSSEDAREVLTLRGHGVIACVAFSPDAGRLLTTSHDSTAKVWEVGSGRQLFTFSGHHHEVWSAAFSHDGRWIVTGGDDRRARVWDAVTGRPLFSLIGHKEAITSVAFSPDDRRIATGSHDHTAKVWDAATGNEVLAIEGHTEFVTSVAFSPDNHLIATGSYDGTAGIWDGTTAKPLFRVESSIAAITSQHAAFVNGGGLTLKGRSASIKSVAFSYDSQRLITGSHDGVATVWGVANGERLLTLQGHRAAVSSVAFSHDDRRIVTGSYDRTAKVWDAAGGKELLTLAGHSGWIHSVDISSNDKFIVTGSGDGTAKIWQAATPQQVAAWQQEETAAARRIDAVRRQQATASEHNRSLRATDLGIIRQWLLLSPIAFEGTNGLTALDPEQISHEARLRPRAGEPVQLGASERLWKAVQLTNYAVDFKQFMGEAMEFSVAYAVCYIHSDVDQTELVMKVGSDDRSKIYLNGREIHRRSNVRTYIADQDAVAGVELKAGINVLVFKVVNETMGSQGSIRFTDVADQPLKGIKVTLDPDPPNR